MSIDERLMALGIGIRNSAQGGNRKTLCPKCSHTRRKKRDPCLSVLISGDTIKWHCFNCGWKGMDRGSNGFERASPAATQGKGHRRRARRPAWLDKRLSPFG